MAKVDATSPDFTGIQLLVGVGTTAKQAGFLVDVNPIIDKSREVKKYTPLNEDNYNEIVALGSLTYGQFTASMLYDPEATEGVNDIEAALDSNSSITMSILLDNAKTATGKGTKYTFICKISSFKVDGEEQGKLKASFTGERMGDPVIVKAT